MYTEGQVARQRPWSGRPGDDADRGVLVEGKGHNYCMEQPTRLTYMYDEFSDSFIHKINLYIRIYLESGEHVDFLEL